jgi:hypothetical protein
LSAEIETASNKIIGEKRMNITKNKTKLTAAVILILLMASSILATMPVKAQDYTNMQEGGSMPLPDGVTPDLTLETIAHMSIRPNPVGVGQTVLVNLWLQPPLQVSRYFSDYTVTITDPDGKTIVEKRDSYRADATSWLEYTPNKVGEYTFKFDFPGGYFPPGNYTVTPGAWIGGQVVSFTESVYYEPSSTEVQTLVVQEDPVESWPASPLPTDYWTRPVSPNNREWWKILGNYPATGFVGGGEDWPADTNIYSSNYMYTPYVQAPNSAHIVWKRQAGLGGLYGPMYPEDSYTSGGAGPSGTPSIIYQGRCYGTISKTENGKPTTYWQCYDLRTGEIYWEQPAALTVTEFFGMQMVSALTPSFIMYQTGWSEVPGGEPSFGRQVYLGSVSGGRLILFDPYSGAIASYGGFFGGGGDYNISIAPLSSGTFYANPYFLSIQTMSEPIEVWPFSRVTGYRLINWTVAGDPGPSGGIINVGLRVANNVSYPFSSIGGFGSAVDYEAGVAVYTQSITHPATGSDVTIDVRIMAASIITGELLWNVSSGVGFGTFPAAIADHGKFAARFNDGHWHCYDLRDGKHLWESEETSFPWGTFGCYGQQSFGGMLLSNQYDGVAAYNWTNGKIVWFYQYKAPYPYETPYQDNYPFFTGTSQIADGKLYTYNTEHTVTQPQTRGWKLHCINITTGEGIWSIDGALSPGAVADGYLTTLSTYDNYMYVFGKGKSATTVTAPDKAITLGDSIVIRGTVTDQSPGQPGTACVSDESMSEWMEYIHMQKPMPKNVTGVPVVLDVLDSNGNYRNIDTVTTDASGTFSYMWEPDIPGKYTLIATFGGSESYGSSWAETAFGVVEAPQATPPPTPEPASAADLYFVPATAGIIVAIAVVGVVLMLMLRKR